MSTTPTLREAAPRCRLTFEQIDAVLRSNGWLRDDMPRARQEKVRESFRRTLEEAAALTQGAGAVEPVAWANMAPEEGEVYSVSLQRDEYHNAALVLKSEAAQQLLQAVAREREECAAICEDTVWTEDIDWWITATKRDVSSRSMLACAAAIRSKGTHD